MDTQMALKLLGGASVASALLLRCQDCGGGGPVMLVMIGAIALYLGSGGGPGGSGPIRPA